ncbi:MAG: TrkH family potassium uptake protein [Devosiaceae bacterium]|nr:TrkH family potassium uptake protein [Devosiaceae bacterium MH13]
MFDTGPIFLIIGTLLATLGVAMMIPALVDLAAANDDWVVFAAASLVTTLVGLGLTQTGSGRPATLSSRQAVLMTVGAWTVLPAFAALPLLWSEAVGSYTDAFFEAMSGITTTGATVITGLDEMPPGILIWRSMLQWLGGLGVVVMAVSILPMLRVGGMQLFKTEAFDTPDKILPRATQISGSLIGVFSVFTFLCALAYAAAGMAFEDAVNHAMTTVATGGFSTRDNSIAAFDSGAVEMVAIVFMILGSLPFLLYVQALQGRPLSLVRDSQVHVFLILLALFSLVIAAVLDPLTAETGALADLRTATFNVVSVMTGTGYASADYGAWGPLAITVFLTLTLIGGCAGSTACGMKVFRVQVALKTVSQHVRRLAYPHGVFVMRYNGRAVEGSVVSAVMSFIFLYFVLIGLLAIALMAMNLDPLTAFSGAATAIANVGPGLGEVIGPKGNFSTLPDAAKWALSGAMLIGRLELFTVLVLILPRFWRS